jgi:hypothetical protein
MYRLAPVILVVTLSAALVFIARLGRGPDAYGTTLPPAPSGTTIRVEPKPMPRVPDSLPVGRWHVTGPHVTEIDLLADGRLTGSVRPGQATVQGSWGAATGTLTARGTSTAPAFPFDCDLVYVEYRRAPQSSYVVADCHNAQERWRWELTRASAR